jgi:hypothetical protein
MGKNTPTTGASLAGTLPTWSSLSDLAQECALAENAERLIPFKSGW